MGKLTASEPARMTNAEFARVATQIAERASNWAFGGVMLKDRLDLPMRGEAARRFTASIREICDWIDEECSDDPPGLRALGSTEVGDGE